MTSVVDMRESVRVAVFDGAGQLLLLRTRDGWKLPGGGVESGEDPRDAARRELREETGIDVERLGRRLGVVETEFEREGRRYRRRETVFELRVTDSLGVAREGHRWWPEAEPLPRVRVQPAQLARLLAEVR